MKNGQNNGNALRAMTLSVFRLDTRILALAADKTAYYRSLLNW